VGIDDAWLTIDVTVSLPGLGSRKVLTDLPLDNLREAACLGFLGNAVTEIEEQIAGAVHKAYQGLWDKAIGRQSGALPD